MLIPLNRERHFTVFCKFGCEFFVDRMITSGGFINFPRGFIIYSRTVFSIMASKLFGTRRRYILSNYLGKNRDDDFLNRHPTALWSKTLHVVIAGKQTIVQVEHRRLNESRYTFRHLLPLLSPRSHLTVSASLNKDSRHRQAVFIRAFAHNGSRKSVLRYGSPSWHYFSRRARSNIELPRSSTRM